MSPDPSSPPIAAAAACSATSVVLVVDDDHSVRRVIRQLLERGGLGVEEAASGREALEVLRRGITVCAVVTDLTMAEGSGGWLLAQLGYEFPGLLPSVLIVTANADGAAAAHVAARWRCPVLSKPFTGQALVGAVRRLQADDAEVAAPPSS